MSEPFLIREHVAVKQRNPWVVFGLSVLTLGVYLAVWYYKVNRELRDYGRTFATPPLEDNPLGVNPAVAVLAISPLSFFLLAIPIYVSTYHTGRRVKRAEELGGSPDSVDLGSGAVLFWLGGIFLPFWAVYLQSHLNTLWETCSRAQAGREPGTAAEWLPDPSGRHEYRYWGGSEWTDNVSDQGRQAVDPYAPAALETPAPTEPAAVPAWLADPTGRHEYRYWDGDEWSEHVSDEGLQAVDPLTPAEPEIPEVPASAETKLCPDCAEEVKAAALVCRFCGHRFVPAGETRELVGASTKTGGETHD